MYYNRRNGIHTDALLFLQIGENFILQMDIRESLYSALLPVAADWRHRALEQTPLVSVVVITYNQEKFIEQALDSILMQETTFPIEILIGDDCSEDGTPEIVRRYEAEHPELIHATCREENVGSTRNSYELYMQARGKYIANLEGDDYWTDPKKLQKQVEFLEAHEEYSCCCTEFAYVDRDGVPFEKSRADRLREALFLDKTVYTLEDFSTSKHPSHPGTWLFRNFFATGRDCSILYKAHRIVGDTTLILILAAMGPFYKLPEVMQHYRMMGNKADSWTTMCDRNPFHLYELFMYHVRLEKYAKNVLHVKVDLMHHKRFEFYHFADNYLRDKTRAKRHCLWTMFQLTDHKMEFLHIFVQALYLATLSGNIRNMYALEKSDRLYQNLNKTWADFLTDLQGRKLILYGAGGGCWEILVRYYDILPVHYIIDRSKDMQGKYIMGYRINSPEKLAGLDREETIFFITSPFYYKEIAEYLDGQGFHHYYAYPVVERKKWKYFPLRFFEKDMDYMRY